MSLPPGGMLGDPGREPAGGPELREWGGEMSHSNNMHDDGRPEAATNAPVTPALQAASSNRSAPGYLRRKHDYSTRLSRVEGQVRGVARMVEEDRYCIDVLVQIAAATKALQQVALGVLDDHMQHCVTDAVHSSPQEAEEKLAEVTRAVALALRL